MGFSNGVLRTSNVDFRGVQPVVGQVTTDGQLMIGSTVAPNIRIGYLQAATGLKVVYGSGVITMYSIGCGMTWSTIMVGTQLAINQAWIGIAGGGGPVALVCGLPTSAERGDAVAITLDGAASWTITQNANQQIRFGNQQTTYGVGGSLASTDQGDTVVLVCQHNGTGGNRQKWNVISSVGNITVV